MLNDKHSTTMGEPVDITFPHLYLIFAQNLAIYFKGKPYMYQA